MFIDSFFLFVENHQLLIYGVLFLVAYFETLIGFSFLIYGELFFLAGSFLAGLGELSVGMVLLSLYCGGSLGDHSSYWIGRKYGLDFYENLKHRPITKRFFTAHNYKTGMHFYRKLGGWSVAVGRFLGPVSWLTPFLAGVNKFPYFRFSVFDIMAVILGIGKFAFVGFMFGWSYYLLLSIVSPYIFIILFVAVCSLIVWYYYRRLLKKIDMTIRHSILHFFSELRKGNRRLMKRAFWTSLFASLGLIILYSLALLLIFFIGNERLNGVIEPDLQHIFTSIEEVTESINSTTYYKKGTQDVGPVNIVMISTKSVDKIMQESGWVKGKTFIRDQVDFITYFKQVRDRIFPISDLYFKGVPQNYAYQHSSSSLSIREHVRIWNYGTLNGSNVYVMSVSKDIGFDFYRNLAFLIPFHAIDPAVDKSRELLIDGIARINEEVSLFHELSVTGSRPEEISSNDIYHTDGLISFIEF